MVEEADGGDAVDEVVAVVLGAIIPSVGMIGGRRAGGRRITYLLLGDGVADQVEVDEPGEAAERVEVGELLNVVLGHAERRQRGHAARHVGLDLHEAVACEQQRRHARPRGEVAQDLDVVVREVDALDVLRTWEPWALAMVQAR